MTFLQCMLLNYDSIKGGDFEVENLACRRAFHKFLFKKKNLHIFYAWERDFAFLEGIC